MFIYPSPHGQDIEELKELILRFDQLCHGYHIDIMDGNFTEKTLGSVELTNQIAQLTTQQLWVHLMVTNPLEYLPQLALRSGDIIAAHHKALKNNHEVFAQQALELNLEPCLAVSPDITIDEVLPFCRSFKHILVMAVTPGASGQKFRPDTFEKISKLIAYRSQKEISLKISVDGGITTKNVQSIHQAGVSIAASTAAIFESENPVGSFQELSLLSS